ARRRRRGTSHACGAPAASGRAATAPPRAASKFPPSDGDCHTPLPCEVRKGNDTTPRACCPSAPGAGGALRFIFGRAVGHAFINGHWPNVRSWGEPDRRDGGNDVHDPEPT